MLRLVLEANGRSKGCGLVEYATQEEAAKAIAELNNTELEGRLIFVREDREPEGGSISKFAKRAAAPVAAAKVASSTSAT